MSKPALQKEHADALLEKLMQGVAALERVHGKKIDWETHLPKTGGPRFSLSQIAQAVRIAAEEAGLGDKLVTLQ